jgi:subtilisin family serine protease
VPSLDYAPNAEQFDAICLPEAWQFMSTRWQGITFGSPWPTLTVIDDGFFATKDSAYRPWLFPGPGSGTADGDPGQPPLYGLHGTSVLSLLASRVNNGWIAGAVGPWTGVANHGTSFFLVRDRNATTPPLPETVAQILGQYVIPYGDRRVVNISQSIAQVISSPQLATQLDQANWQQIVVATGAGNKRETISANAWIRGFENVIVVGGLSSNGGKLWLGGAGVGSATGAGVDLYAPAENLEVIIRDSQIVTDSGTSFSSPLVAAVAAMMLNLDPSLDSWVVRDILVKSADSGTYRRLNAIKALLCIDTLQQWATWPPPNSNQVPVRSWSCAMAGFGNASGQRVGW